jgi:hypothetical protein
MRASATDDEGQPEMQRGVPEPRPDDDSFRSGADDDLLFGGPGDDPLVIGNTGDDGAYGGVGTDE